MEEERSSSLGQVVDPGLDGLEVAGPHVLACVHPEALDANVDEVVEIVSDLAADIVAATVEVVERDKVAVSHLCVED